MDMDIKNETHKYFLDKIKFLWILWSCRGANVLIPVCNGKSIQSLIEAMAGDPIHPLMDDYPLLSCFEREGDKPIPDAHLDQISRTCSEKWRYLPAHLELPDSMATDTARDGKNEEERRHIFFFGWKQTKGSHATYRRLVNAFLKIECREDAENVCKFFQALKSVQPPSPPVRSKSQAPGSYSHSVEIPKKVIVGK